MAPIHFLILVHGMWGSPSQLAELARITRETHQQASSDGTELHVLVAESITGPSTYDGIDWGGERVAKEVTNAVESLEKGGDRVTRFSATGFSLGGLIARYCITVLDKQGFFKNIDPVNFTAIASPHCGLPRYNSLISSMTSTLGPKLLSRSGEQMYCVDKWSANGRPLLLVMADPARDFYKALSKFQHINIYANAVNDKTVPYVTASFDTEDRFVDYEKNGMVLEFDEKFDHVIKQFSIPDTPPAPLVKPIIFSPAWFKNLKAPPLPPFLQFRFPFNMLVYATLPVLVPLLIPLVITLLSIASRSSRTRIKALERGAEKDTQPTLFKLLCELEHGLESTIADPAPKSLTPISNAHPILTSTHMQISAWLNTLPVKKSYAFFPKEPNSHAIIVCRDIKKFESQREGQSVLRHWATSFVL